MPSSPLDLHVPIFPSICLLLDSFFLFVAPLQWPSMHPHTHAHFGVLAPLTRGALLFSSLVRNWAHFFLSISIPSSLSPVFALVFCSVRFLPCSRLVVTRLDDSFVFSQIYGQFTQYFFQIQRTHSLTGTLTVTSLCGH